MQIGPFGHVLVSPSDESVRTKGSLLPIGFISHLGSTASQLPRYLPRYDILPFLVLAYIIHSKEIYDRYISATHKVPMKKVIRSFLYLRLASAPNKTPNISLTS